MEKNQKYKLFGTEDGKPTRLVKEFSAPSLKKAQEILTEIAKDPQYLFTHLYLFPVRPPDEGGTNYMYEIKR